MSDNVLTIKTTDITSLRDATNAASVGARAAWLAFLGLTAYLFIAIAGVSHRDLLLNAPVSLPIFQVQIPLDRFFLFAPLVFIAVHFGVLVQHVLLTQKAALLHQLLSEREREISATNGTRGPDPIRYTVESYFITQAIAGPARRTLLAMFLENMTWLSLVIVPILLLIAFQVAFLPFHDLTITWAHRIILGLELFVVVLLGAYLGAPVLRLGPALWNTIRYRPFRLLFAITVAATAAFFSTLVATIPGEKLDDIARTLNPKLSQSNSSSRPFWLTRRIFEGDVDPITGRSTSPFLRNLVVADADLVVDDANRSRNDRTLSLRGRDLRFATLDRTDLQGADLTGANLREASLQGTRLTDAILTASDLRGALFWRQGQEDIDFVAADLSGASFRRARMDSANLHGVRARATDFSGANLIGSTFLNADLRGADFQAANLVAVGFAGANLDGARLKNAKLDATRFEQARLRGADLSSAALYGVQLTGADLTGADLRGGPVWATAMPRSVQGLDLQYRIPVPPNAPHLAWLKQQLSQAWTPDGGVKLRANIGHLFDAVTLKSWRDTSDFSAWKSASQQPASPINRQQVLTDLLSDAACADGTARAAVAMGLARRAGETFLFAPQFNGDVDRFHAALSAPSCQAVFLRIPLELRQAVRRAAGLAKEAARKSVTPNE